MIIAGTNVVSELMRPAPDSAVTDWVRQHRGQLWTTAITQAEVLYGIERLPDGLRKDQIARIASDVFSAFADRFLAFGSSAARQYALLVVGRDRVGWPIDGFDAQIAAICRVQNASIATRNIKDFRGTGIQIVDPWAMR